MNDLLTLAFQGCLLGLALACGVLMLFEHLRSYGEDAE
jgi:hypothetical protein